MRSVALAAFVALAFTLPADALAEPGAQGTYFCYWVDASKKQAATTKARMTSTFAMLKCIR